jgi:hypothetical protein
MRHACSSAHHRNHPKSVTVQSERKREQHCGGCFAAGDGTDTSARIAGEHWPKAARSADHHRERRKRQCTTTATKRAALAETSAVQQTSTVSGGRAAVRSSSSDLHFFRWPTWRQSLWEASRCLSKPRCLSSVGSRVTTRVARKTRVCATRVQSKSLLRGTKGFNATEQARLLKRDPQLAERLKAEAAAVAARL